MCDTSDSIQQWSGDDKSDGKVGYMCLRMLSLPSVMSKAALNIGSQYAHGTGVPESVHQAEIVLARMAG